MARLFWAWIEVRDDADPEHAEEALLEQVEGFLEILLPVFGNRCRGHCLFDGTARYGYQQN